jgi:hypothetical protein
LQAIISKPPLACDEMAKHSPILPLCAFTATDPFFVLPAPESTSLEVPLPRPATYQDWLTEFRDASKGAQPQLELTGVHQAFAYVLLSRWLTVHILIAGCCSRLRVCSELRNCHDCWRQHLCTLPELKLTLTRLQAVLLIGT